ncbi:fimbrial protein [Acinetobacter sp.]|uniref:fimbrial protein n=1 Tax=Acinetobacter sp. TaxID=472 RepID=UPI0031CFC9DD
MYKTIISSSLATALGLSLAMTTQAADQGHGKVTFKGEIVNAPCSIAPESVDQVVYLGQISNSALAASGESTPKPFSIELEDCDFGTATQPNLATGAVSITFSGSTVDLGNSITALGVTGFGGDPLAGNVGIIISSAANNEAIKFGTAQNLNGMLQPGYNTMNFSAYLKTKDTATTAADIPLGEFQGITNFTLSYISLNLI